MNYNLLMVLVSVIVMAALILIYGKDIKGTGGVISESIEHIFGNYTVLAIMMVGAIGIVAMFKISDKDSMEKVLLSCISGILGAATGYALKAIQNSMNKQPPVQTVDPSKPPPAT